MLPNTTRTVSHKPIMYRLPTHNNIVYRFHPLLQTYTRTVHLIKRTVYPQRYKPTHVPFNNTHVPFTHHVTNLHTYR